MTASRPSALVAAAFHVDPKTGVWISRAGKTTRGQRPRYLDWPSHTAAEMAREAWLPVRPLKTQGAKS